jgi:hypothetical protein
MPPGGYQLRVPERNRAVLLLNDGLEHVIGLAVEHNRRGGGRFDVDLVKLFFAAADQLGSRTRARRRFRLHA